MKRIKLIVFELVGNNAINTNQAMLYCIFNNLFIEL